MRSDTPLPAAALLFAAGLLLCGRIPSAAGLLCGGLGALPLFPGALLAWRLLRGTGCGPAALSRLVLRALPLTFLPLGIFVASAEVSASRSPLEIRLEAEGGRLAHPADVTGTLRSEPVPSTDRGGGCLVDLAAERIEIARVQTPTRGNVRIRLPRPSPGVADPCLLVPGSRIRLATSLALPQSFGNPGAADRRAQLRALGIVATGRAPSARLVEVIRPAGPVAGGLSAARRRILAAQERAFGLAGKPAAAGVARAIVLGYREHLPEDMVRALRAGGTAHLLAISGFHVALLHLCALAAARSAGAGRSLRSACVLAALAIYLALAGPLASVRRAVSASVLVLVCHQADRRPAPAAILGSVFLALAASRPAAIAGPSFQLSFLATAALVTLAPPLASSLPGPRRIAWTLAANVSAVLGTAPLSTLLFNRATPAAVVANLVVAPIMGLAFIASLAAPLVGTMAPALAALRVDLDPGLDAGGALASLAALAFSLSARFSEWVATPAFMSYRVTTPDPGLVAAVVGAGGLALWKALPALLRRTLLGAAAAGIVWMQLPCERADPGMEGSLRATFLDVGQGSSTLIETEGGRRVLVDAGGFAGTSFDVGERVVARALLTMGLRSLDAVVVSHADVDHSGGMSAILEIFQGAEIWTTPAARSNRRVSDLLSHALARGRVLRLLTPNRPFRFGGTLFRTLHPPPGMSGGNDASLVLSVVGRGGSILLPGDIGPGPERELSPSLSRSEVLLVPHHGSRMSATAPFLAAVGASWAVISCGPHNRYGHPSPLVLAKLEEAGSHVLRTDLHGAVRIELPAPTAGDEAVVQSWSGGGWQPRSRSAQNADRVGNEAGREEQSGKDRHEAAPP